MSSESERSFWKSKASHLPGCIKPLNSNGRISRKSSLKKEVCEREEGCLLGGLELSRVRQTALEVIKRHNQQHGHKDIHLIEQALNDTTVANTFSNTAVKPPNNKLSNGLNSTQPPATNHADHTPSTPPFHQSLKTPFTPSYPTTTIDPSHQNQTGQMPRPPPLNTAATYNKTPTSNYATYNSSPPPTSDNIPPPTTITPPSSTTTIIPLPSLPTTIIPSSSSPSTTTIPPSSPSSTSSSRLLLSSSLPSSSACIPGRGVRSPPQQPSQATEVCCNRLCRHLHSTEMQLCELRGLCWSGIPRHSRSLAWKLLCSYIPLQPSKRQNTLSRKRSEYAAMVAKYYDDEVCRKVHHEAYHQIHIDVPRMGPGIPLFQQLLVQQVFERVMYVWAIRHPASGYVQGMNDLLIPFFVVFITPHVSPGEDLMSFDVASLGDKVVAEVEADSFWCLCRLLDGIQDNYTFAQPGIQKQVNTLKELMSRIDNTLHHHLLNNHVEYLQFAFRWVNNLLMRELPLACSIRLWDTYLCEPEGFASFHLYVCATLLHRFSPELLNEHDFQGLMLFLKSLPTENWTEADVALLLADAYRLQYAFADAPKHLVET